MLTKIILTLLVIAGCIWFASSKREQQRQPLLVIASKQDQQRKAMLRRGAYIFMFVMVTAAMVMIYVEIADRNETVTVYVINTQNGERTGYQARRDDVQASKFTTLAGRQVFVAGIERIEVETH